MKLYQFVIYILTKKKYIESFLKFYILTFKLGFQDGRHVNKASAPVVDGADNRNLANSDTSMKIGTVLL